MIAFVGATPTDDEAAAVTVALQSIAHDDAPAPTLPSAWALAMRRDDLEYDDLRALVSGR